MNRAPLEMKNVGTRTALLALCVVSIAVANFGTLQELVALARAEASASHVVAVPFVAATLVFRQRREIFQCLRWSPALAAVLFLLGLGLSIATGSVSPASAFGFRTAAVASWWAAGFALCYGAPAFRQALFPMLFLAFMVPLPEAVLRGMTSLLKSGTAEVVAALFSLTGTPHHREAYVFFLETVAIEIADECSGIRSTIALLMAALLAGQLLLHRPVHRLLVVLAVFPITVFKNGVRITTLSLLSVHVDPAFLAGRLHHDGGVVFFALALLMLLPFVLCLRRIGTRNPPPRQVLA